jgi:glycerol-3-phosphate dehydrogenase
MGTMKYDVAVIGAGVVGCLTARALSMKELSVCVIEAGADVAEGSSKANSGIVHAGYDAESGSLKARFNVAGAAMIPQLAADLGVPYEQSGSFVVAFGAEDERQLEKLHERGNANGVETRIISGNEARAMEPALSAEITAALYAPAAGIICPYTLTIAAAENAAANRVRFFFNSRVTAVSRKDGGFVIEAGENTIEARSVVNAAGVHAGDISAMAGGEEIAIRPRKGEYIVFDKSMAARTKTVIFGAPSQKGKGVLFAPTAHGNMIAGPTAEFTEPDDVTTSRAGLEKALEGAKRYAPGLERRAAIAVFAGLRAASEGHDFIVEASNKVPGLVQAAGIESPGLTASPAIAEHVVELLSGIGISGAERKDAVRTRKPIESFAHATPERRKELIAMDSRYAHIVCRCETVTEAEIVEAIHRPCGATTVDGVKFRTRAGTGRCHGGFCLPRVMDILSRELGKSVTEIAKNGLNSEILVGRTKEGQL